MALPKRRFSRSRRDKRRLQIHLRNPSWTRCPQCGATVLTHRACPACGNYRGRAVLSVAREEKPKS